MKKNKIYLLGSIFFIFSSCSSFDEDILKDDTSSFLIKNFVFNLSKSGFDDELNTRADNTWVEGDKIFLLFDSESNLAYGDAIYTNGNWTVNEYGNLTPDSTVNCKAYFFENMVSEANATISLNEASSIFEDLSGTYTFKDGTLSVTATLKPKTGRIRFTGVNHTEIQFSGVSHYTTFNRYMGEYTSTDSKLSSKVDGEYTPYVYGFFTDTSEPHISLWNDDNDAFIRYFSSNVFTAGQSGYLTIPTSKSHNGWLLYFE